MAWPGHRPLPHRAPRVGLASQTNYDGAMTEAEIAKLATWLAKAGLEGRTETALVEGFCSRAVAAGLPLARVMMLIDTLHPIHEGRAFRWEKEKPNATLTEYGRTAEGEAAERWRIGVAPACDCGDRS